MDSLFEKDFCDFFGCSPSEVVERFRRLSDEEVLDVFVDYFAARKILWRLRVCVSMLML